ncbi:helix-turn-helix domain-containing protein [Achromobacter insolitus]|uniref:helix-turn-helix domain-containing protein n=1 Tax=Achromobacter insolitus TaxID=217204 RepID=UPI001EED8CF5|nr:helix-turn-helix transcriptional regulator [Achromobacter insolitus]
MSVLGNRLKEARLRAKLSQEKLGIEAGLDPMSASARMNRYELGNRIPDPELVERLGKVLQVPAPYFYAADDDIARLLLAVGPLPEKERMLVVEFAERLLG